jgi:tRNA 2-thiouridine synthesizing protein C
MNARRLLFLIRHPPHRGALPFETLDELLVGAVFDQQISVLFVGDGVFQLVDSGQTTGNVARGFRALPTYDVHDVYVDKSSLRQRGLTTDALVLPVRALTRGRVGALIAAQDVVIPG